MKDMRNKMEPSFSVTEIGIDDRDLRIEIFSLCESAVEQGGRLSMLGTYEIVHSSQFPMVLPAATVALRVRFWPAESRQQAIAFVLTNPDGRTIGAPTELTVALRPFCGERSAAYNLVIRLPDLQIEEPGEHTLDLYLNGKMEGRLPLGIFAAAVMQGDPS